MILCIGTTPTVQRVMIFDSVKTSAVNRAVQTIEDASGKSLNVAKVLRVLGEDVVATGFLGGDRGEFVRAALSRMGVKLEFVPIAPQTRMCVTVVDRAAGTHTELVEESAPADAKAWDALRAKIAELVRRARFVTMSGTIVTGGPPEFYADCVKFSNEAGVPVLVDATGQAMKLALTAGPTFMKVNRGELASAVEMTLDAPESIVRAMHRAIGLGAGKVVVTLGGKGAMASDGKRAWRITVPSVKVNSTIGSGDSFTAGLVKGLVDGAELPEACRLGGACGAANALTAMSGDVHIEDVRRIQPQVSVEEL